MKKTRSSVNRKIIAFGVFLLSLMSFALGCTSSSGGSGGSSSSSSSGSSSSSSGSSFAPSDISELSSLNLTGFEDTSFNISGGNFSLSDTLDGETIILSGSSSYTKTGENTGTINLTYELIEYSGGVGSLSFTPEEFEDLSGEPMPQSALITLEYTGENTGTYTSITEFTDSLTLTESGLFEFN